MSTVLDVVEITVGGNEPEGALSVRSKNAIDFHTATLSRSPTAWLWTAYIDECVLISGSPPPVAVTGTSTARLTHTARDDPLYDTLTVTVDDIERAVYAVMYHAAGWDRYVVTFDDDCDCWVSHWAHTLTGGERTWNLHSVRDRVDWSRYPTIPGYIADSTVLDPERVLLHGGQIINATMRVPVWLYLSETTELTEETL
jgi:hypothetical protein